MDAFKLSPLPGRMDRSGQCRTVPRAAGQGCIILSICWYIYPRGWLDGEINSHSHSSSSGVWFEVRKDWRSRKSVDMAREASILAGGRVKLLKLKIRESATRFKISLYHLEQLPTSCKLHELESLNLGGRGQTEIEQKFAYGKLQRVT